MTTRKLVAFLAAVVLVVSVGTFAVAWRIRSRAHTPRGPSILVEVRAPDTSSSNEARLLRPLESAVRVIAHVEHVEGRATASGATLLLTLEPRADVDAIEREVHDAVAASLRALPPDALPPTVQRVTPRDGPRFALENPPLPLAEMRTRLDEEVVQDLERLPGVASVDLCGGLEPAMRVAVAGDRLPAVGVDAAQLAASLRSAIALAPPASVADLRDLEVARGVRLSDVATLSDSGRPPSCVAYDEHGALIVGAIAWQPGAKPNPAVVSRELATRAALLPAGARVVPIDMDGARHVRAFVELASPPDAETLARTAASLASSLVVPGARKLLVTSPRSPRPGVDLEIDAVLPHETSFSKLDAARRALSLALAKTPGLVAATETDDEPHVTARIVGSDADADRRAAAALRAALGGAPGVIDSMELGVRDVSERTAKVGRRAADLGISARDVETVLRLTTTGEDVGRTRDRTRAVWLHVSGEYPSLSVRRGGSLVALSSLVDWSAALEPEVVEHWDGQRAITLWVGLASASDLRAAKSAAAKTPLPAGVSVLWDE